MNIHSVATHTTFYDQKTASSGRTEKSEFSSILEEKKAETTSTEPEKDILKMFELWSDVPRRYINGQPVISGPDLKACTIIKERKFKEKINADLSRMGVNTNREFEIAVNRDGSLRISGDHPEKEKIEKYLNDNKEIRNECAEIMGRKELIALWEKEHGPIDAVKAYAEMSARYAEYERASMLNVLT